MRWPHGGAPYSACCGPELSHMAATQLADPVASSKAAGGQRYASSSLVCWGRQRATGQHASARHCPHEAVLAGCSLCPALPCPAALQQNPPKTGMDDAREEFETVVYQAVDEALRKTGERPAQACCCRCCCGMGGREQPRAWAAVSRAAWCASPPVGVPPSFAPGSLLGCQLQPQS